MITTQDRFLGGRLTIEQPQKGYRAGVDPVFLAAAVPARAGQSVLDLGCGVGVASLCLGARVPGLNLYGVEINADHAALAVKNADANGITFHVAPSDLAALPDPLRSQTFDHVIANPPYFSSGTKGAGALARHEAIPLATWLTVGAKRLSPKGRLTLILRPDRLQDALAQMPSDMGSIEIQPLSPREGRDTTLVLISAVKGGRAALCLRAPILLHDGAAHTTDGNDYSAIARAVLRDGAALKSSAAAN